MMKWSIGAAVVAALSQLASVCQAQSVILVASNTAWRYLDNGTDQGTAWRAPSFNDSSWSNGVAQFGYGDGDEATVINSGPAGNVFITTYFRRAFTVTNAAGFASLTVRLLRDDGAVVYLNGQEALRDNMLGGAVTYTTTAVQTVGGTDESTFFAYAVAPTLLVEGTNVIAVEIHQLNSTSSDVSFNLELSGSRNAAPTVGLTSPANDAQFLALADIGMAATAADADGIAKVEFFQGTTKLGEDLASPYGFMWSGVVAGSYQLRAVATDTLGTSATSAVVNIVVTNAPVSSGTNTLIAYGSTWKYFDKGVDQGTAWKEFTFNDSTWSNGVAQLGYGDGDEVTTNSSGPDPANKYPTTYFRRAFVVSNPAAYTSLTLNLLRDDGGVVYLNGTEIFRGNMPGGAILYSTYAAAVGPDNTIDLADVSAAIPYLNSGSNVLAVEIHQSDAASSDVSFDFQLVGVTGTPGNNAPPTVALSSPANGASFNLPANITLQATASDPDGVVSRVEFFANGSKVGEDTSSPFSILWPNVPSGGYALTAVATDNGALRATSAPVNITVTTTLNQRPTVILTSPSGGSIFSAPTNIPLSATATDADGSVSLVEFFVGSTKVAGDATSPFNGVWSNALIGTFALSAIATDNSGATATSAPVSITVTGAAPTKLVAREAVWKYLDNGTDQGSAWIAPGFNDSAWASGPAELGYGDAQQGRPEATVVSYGSDANNKYITTYFRRAFSVANPANFRYLTLRLQRDDGGVVYLNGTEVFRSNIPSGPVNYLTAGINASDDGTTLYATTVTNLLVPGANVLAVEIHQDSGTSSDISFDLELIGETGAIINNLPAVALASPSAGARYTEPANITINVTATDSDGTISKVEFYQGATKLGEDVASPYTWVWAGVPAGNYTLRAVATDNLGGVSTSSVVNVTVAVPSPPTLASTVPAPGSTVNALTQLTVNFNEPVQGVDAADLLVNLVPATTVTAGNGNMAYTFTFPQPIEGPVNLGWAAAHGIVDMENPPQAFDATAPGASWQYTLVDTLAPTVAFVSPAQGATVPELTRIDVVFSEPVGGIQATDLVINGLPATSVTGSGAGSYAFGFSPPTNGLVQVAWAASHGIRDVAVTPNAFGGGAWSYTLNTNVTETNVVINEIMYHPAHAATAAEPVAEEFIELYNKGNNALNLTGWRFSGGVAFTFPNVTLPARGYLVVAANRTAFAAKYPGVTNVVGDWDGRLSNTDDDLDLDNALGQRIDSVHYADEGDWAVRRQIPDETAGRPSWEWVADADGAGKTLELMNAALPNQYGQNWTSTGPANGTPGRTNSVATNNLAPMILEVAHFPPIPTTGDVVRITARLLDEQAGGLSAALFYRLGTDPFSAEPMFDDGAHGDGAAGDGLFAATLPAQTNRAVVEFYVSAGDAGGRIRTWPGPTDAGGTQGANALYQVDNSTYTGPQPFYRMIMTEVEDAQLSEINNTQPGSNARMNGTWISLDSGGAEIRYQIGIRHRGAGSRGIRPPNLRVTIPGDRRWKGVTSLNLNVNYTHSQLAGSIVCREAGMTSEGAIAVQVRRSGTNYANSGLNQFGSVIHLESRDSDWCRNHYPLDPNGNLYTCTRPNASLDHLGPNPQSYVGAGYLKDSNTSEHDYSDLTNLTYVFDIDYTPDDRYEAAVRQVLNVEQWLRYFAVMSLIGYNETSIGSDGAPDDFTLYRGANDPRFLIYPHDHDTDFGQGSPAAPTTYGVFRATANANVNRFLKWPAFAPLYYAELKHQVETAFASPGIDQLLDAHLGGWVPTSYVTAMKSWIAARRANVWSQIPLSLTLNATGLGQQNGYAYTTAPSVALSGKANVIETRQVRVNGQLASWVAWQGDWSVSSLALQPGINRVVVQALNAAGQEFERLTLDIWYDDSSVTTVSGAIAGSQTWTPANGPYQVTANLSIGTGATLTIQPGTTVYLDSGVSINVFGGGRLLAEGTEGQRVRFTRFPGTTGTWGNLSFVNASGESRMAYADLEYAGASGPVIRASAATLYLDHLTFANVSTQYVNLTNTSFVIRHSVFPSLSGVDLIRGGAPPASGRAIIEGNWFGTTTGLNDILNFTGGQRPNAILQVLNNTFTGASDDVLQLDGADAHIEGNLFLNVHQTVPGGDTSAAIAGGAGAQGTSDLMIVRNLFYDCDQAAVALQGNFYLMENNTLVRVTNAVVSFGEPLRGVAGGGGAYLDGNIIWDAPRLFANYTSAVMAVTVNRCILPTAWPGTDNLTLDPMLTRTTGVTWQTITSDYVLRAGSPAIATGPNGLDRGGLVPAGASIRGEPVSPTPLTSATLTVAGPGVTHYRYRLDNSAWSGEFAVSTPIALSGLASGLHTVSVVGKSSAGVYQDTNHPSVSRPWIVNPNASGLRLNEVLASNGGAVTFGSKTPDLIELYNGGPAPVDLTGMGLTDNRDEPFKYIFPPTTTLAPGQYLVLYADNDSTPPGLHLGFSIKQEGDDLYLFAPGGKLLDSVRFGLQLTDLSIGRLADGGWALTQPAFGAANLAARTGNPGTLVINEWLTVGVIYPNDFIELSNPDPLPVALGGLYLTDAPTGAPTRHAITPLSFAPGGGFVVFVADGDAGAGANHVSFRLNSSQGMIALFDADLTLIDSVLYGPQQSDVSSGRCASHPAGITTLVIPTPGAPNACPFVPPPPASVSLLTISNVWRYEQSGTDLGTSWSGVNYPAETSWPTGQGLLAALTTTRPQTLPEPIRTTLKTNLNRITFYFRTHFTVPPDATFSSLEYRHIVDDGAVFYLNGVEVGRFNMPGGTISFDTVAAGTVNDAAYQGPISLSPALLVPGDNVFAVEVHQAATNSSDVAFGLELSGLILTNSPALAGVVINEVLANNATLEEADESKPDWVEIYNPSSNAVDLAEMSLTDNTADARRWVFPTGSIVPALGFRRVRCDGDLPASSTNTGFGLRAGGGAVHLFNRPAEGGAPASAVAYGPQAADFSIGRVPDGSTNWVLTLVSLGRANIAVGALGEVANLKVNEWMASVSGGPDWFELYNANPQPVALGGLYLSDEPANRVKHPVAPLSFIGIGGYAYQKFVADGDTGAGADHVAFSLRASGEAVGVYTATGLVLDERNFGAQTTDVSEGRLPDGAATIVPFPGTASSPGDANHLPLTNVVINEVLTHSDLPLEDAIELRNLTAASVNVGGWYLSDNRHELQKYRIPTNTILSASGFKVLYEVQFNDTNFPVFAFSLNSAKGDEVYLAQFVSNRFTGYRTHVKFGAGENGVSFGRHPTSVGTDFTAMSRRTFGVDSPDTVTQFRGGTGAANPYPKVGPVVISEIMYHPPDLAGGADNVADEFIELQNITGNPVPLYHLTYPTNTWRLRDAVSFSFPPGTSLPANGALLVVSFDPVADPAALAAFRSKYQLSSGIAIHGPYSGKLDNGAESVELYKPDAPQLPPDPDAGYVPYILADRVAYADRDPWPIGADGTGASLQRINTEEYGNDPVNWRAASPTPGPVFLDTDGDGMPDNWETAHGLNPNDPTDAGLDPDLDGLTNLQEYLAGTEPFELRLGVVQGGSVTLYFFAQAGQSYSILHRGAVDSGTWTKLQDVPAGAARWVQVTDAPPGSARFYRLRTPAGP